MLRRLVVLMVVVLCGSTAAWADPSADCHPDKDADLSIRACTTLIEQNPGNALAYYNRSVAYYDKGEYDRAIADFTKAIEIEPNANRYSARAVAYEKKSDNEQAIADYRRAQAKDPNHHSSKDALKRLGASP